MLRHSFDCPGENVDSVDLAEDVGYDANESPQFLPAVTRSNTGRRCIVSKKILVVDDERHIRMLYREELQGDEYDVAATDGLTPIAEVLENEKPDLVVLDIKLEGNPLTGLDILQIIRASNATLPVILSTSYDSFQNDLKSIAADAYVVKSVDLSMLKAAIRQVLQKKSE
jgi:DNA-binding response OmpR family regulator